MFGQSPAVFTSKQNEENNDLEMLATQCVDTDLRAELTRVQNFTPTVISLNDGSEISTDCRKPNLSQPNLFHAIGKVIKGPEKCTAFNRLKTDFSY